MRLSIMFSSILMMLHVVAACGPASSLETPTVHLPTPQPTQVAPTPPMQTSSATIPPTQPPNAQPTTAPTGMPTSAPTGPGIVIPTVNARVMLPLHILAQIGQPGETVTATLRWEDGTELSNTFELLPAPDGAGLLIDNLDWINMLAPPQPPTQPAMLQLRNAAGEVLGQQPLTILGAGDPEIQEIEVYWTISGTETVGPQRRQIVQTERVGAAAIEELLWGPPPISQVGYGTAIPMPRDVLSYPGREPDWGSRVTLRQLTIEDGVAVADFSQELRAYGGGSLRVKLIRDQITRTLMQFPTIKEVRIAIEGQTEGILEP